MTDTTASVATGEIITKLGTTPGQAKMFYSPAALAACHHVPAELAGKLAGINALTDALVAD
jgi:hypothetical protein